MTTSSVALMDGCRVTLVCEHQLVHSPTMSLRLTPLLEKDDDNSSWEVNSLGPKQFVDLMDLHKALLIQSTGTPFCTDDFGQFVVDKELEYYPYIGGAAPRTVISTKATDRDVIFTANESPPDQPIPFHHELAQTPNPPEYVFFYCHTAAPEGGETPIIDSTAVYRFTKEHHSSFLQKLHEHGARYTRTLPAQDDPSSPIGRSYQNTWNVKTPQELDDVLSNIDGCEWKWLEDGSVRITTEAVPALRMIADHEQNNVFQYTFCNSVVAAYLGWEDSRNDRKEALTFGNHEKMPEDVLESIATFMQENRVIYPWKAGDILALQNMLVMHSRNPYDPSFARRVLASIWGPPANKNVEPSNGIALGSRPGTFYDRLTPADPLVFGFWKVGKDICEEICYHAIKTGYRRLDCACDYGNEEEVGKGIARAIKDGLCKREDLFVTSKLWNTYHQHVKQAAERTLKDLQLDYLDEYLIHFPISLQYVPFDQKYPPEWQNMEGNLVAIPNDMCKTWSDMESLVDEGLTKTIGVCNFSTQLLRQVLSTCRIRPVTLQVELHPLNSQAKLIRFARDAGMRVTAFSVFGPASYVELGMATEEEVLWKNPVILDLANKKRRTAAQIMLRWALQRNTLPLCKTSNVSRMKDNRDVFDFYLNGTDMKRIDALNQNRRFNDPGVFCESMGTFYPIYD